MFSMVDFCGDGFYGGFFFSVYLTQTPIDEVAGPLVLNEKIHKAQQHRSPIPIGAGDDDLRCHGRLIGINCRERLSNDTDDVMITINTYFRRWEC